ncbi:glycosyltransferase family 4 protein [Flavobacterium xinjiangense]|jgi:glycosyltransferase involved in cell wall biosynthesis|uniref:Glycosyltransferase involved in cell wall bisynthesis n=1 Tax=Flavobacterium xinjiangense TaxID=178356 RepID=A0A1M7MSP7_9FLAO|nr:glycosyltransferase family 4 protein [Flavobacterium xinjiangense]SHM94040.1 Glycosyltransferase involved in cell wall bisynthesis [Flavobacterium xinjiangense]
MNILFLTLVKIKTLEERGIYTDLLRKFKQEGHRVFVVSPSERRDKKKTHLVNKDGVCILNVFTFNLQKTNVLEKGIGTLAIEYQYLNAIKKHFSTTKFDLILYSTPPITFSKVIDFVKKRDNAYSYLLLKDIFPQNAVDMKMFKNGGVLHKFFLKKELELYDLSDTIGCMSEANKKYILTHNPSVNKKKVEVNPNSIEPIHTNQTVEENREIKKKYGLPLDKTIFVYGGNLGKPQGLDFLLETIESNRNQDVFFLVVGSGTEYNRIEKWFVEKQLKNALLMSGLPKLDYDLLLNSCDVGMIFLDKNFTIPNFPSRLLSYLEMGMPVIAATDSNTDLGDVLEKHKCGFRVLAGDILNMNKVIDEICCNEDRYIQMSEDALRLLNKEYKVDYSYSLIKNKINNV